MKIDNSLKPVTAGTSAGKAAAPKTGTDTKTPTESVQISALSNQLKAMESSMTNTPVVNLDRVNQIKQAISEGRFKINPEAISNKLISSVKDLIQSQQHNG